MNTTGKSSPDFGSTAPGSKGPGNPLQREGLLRDGVRLFMVLLASFLMAVNIRTFVNAGGLYPGGITGVTVLIQRIFQKYLNMEIPYSLVNILLNVFPVYVGFRFIGKKFTLLSVIMIIANSFIVDLLPTYIITYDTLLISIFGGILNGVAISICLLADATSGGTDFFSIYLSQQKGIDAFNIILMFNIALLCIAGALFGWEKALYSIIFQYVSTQMLHILYRNYQQQTLFIITDHPQEICEVIFDCCHHGATIMHGEGSHEHKDRGVVYSVVSGSDIRKVILAVKEADEHAFINSIRTDAVKGNFYLKPRD